MPCALFLTGSVSSVLFDEKSHFLISSGAKYTHIFYNVVGLQANIQDLENHKARVKHDAARNSIQQQIDEVKYVKINPIEKGGEG